MASSSSREGCRCNTLIIANQLHIDNKVSSSSSADNFGNRIISVTVKEMISPPANLFSEYIQSVGRVCPLITTLYSCQQCSSSKLPNDTSGSSAEKKKATTFSSLSGYCLGRNVSCVCCVTVRSRDKESEHDGILVPMGINRAVLYVDNVNSTEGFPRPVYDVIVEKYGGERLKKRSHVETTSPSSVSSSISSNVSVVRQDPPPTKRKLKPTLIIAELPTKSSNNSISSSSSSSNKLDNLRGKIRNFGSNHEKSLLDLYNSDYSGQTHSDNESVGTFNSPQETKNKDISTPQTGKSEASESSISMEVSAEKKSNGIALEHGLSRGMVPIENNESSLFPVLKQNEKLNGNTQSQLSRSGSLIEDADLYVSCSGFGNDSLTYKEKSSTQNDAVASKAINNNIINPQSPSFFSSLFNSVVSNVSSTSIFGIITGQKSPFASPTTIERKLEVPAIVNKFDIRKADEEYQQTLAKEITNGVTSSSISLEQSCGVIVDSSLSGGSTLLDSDLLNLPSSSSVDDDFLHISTCSNAVEPVEQDHQSAATVTDSNNNTESNSNPVISECPAIQESLTTFSASQTIEISKFLEQSIITTAMHPVDCGRKIAQHLQSISSKSFKQYQMKMGKVLKMRFGHHILFTKYFCKMCIIHIIANIELLRLAEESNSKAKKEYCENINYTMSRLQIAFGVEELNPTEDIPPMLSYTLEDNREVLLIDLLESRDYKVPQRIDYMVFVLKELYSHSSVWLQIHKMVDEFDHNRKMLKPSPIKSTEPPSKQSVATGFDLTMAKIENDSFSLPQQNLTRTSSVPPTDIGQSVGLKRTNSLVNKEKKSLSHRDTYGTRKEVTRNAQPSMNVFNTLPSNIAANENGSAKRLTRSATSQPPVRAAAAVFNSPLTDEVTPSNTNRLKRARSITHTTTTTAAVNDTKKAKHVLFSPSPKKRQRLSHDNTDSSASTVIDASFHSPVAGTRRSRIQMVTGTPMS